MRLVAVIIIASLWMVGGCLTGCSTVRPTGQTEAEILYKEAQSLTKSGRYLLAIEKLNTLRSQYPYSFYATSAELLMGDILYKQHNYVEAAGAFINFYDDHPTHPQLPYVIWMIAESFTAQNPSTSDRDLSTAVEANHFYRELVRRFPDAEQVPAAQEKMQKNQAMLQEKAINIADFYYPTMIFLPVRPVSATGPPITNFPVGFTKISVLSCIRSAGTTGLMTFSITVSLIVS